jgi:hypothetical protein
MVTVYLCVHFKSCLYVCFVRNGRIDRKSFAPTAAAVFLPFRNHSVKGSNVCLQTKPGAPVRCMNDPLFSVAT